MVDNVGIATGSGGATIAADEIGGIHYQRVKGGFGTDGDWNETATSVPLPVQIESTRIAADTAASGLDNGFVWLAVRKDTLAEATQVDGDYLQPRTASDGALWTKQAAALYLASGTATIPVVVSNHNNEISTDNSTTTTLVSGGTYTGTPEDVSLFSSVTTAITTDHASADDGMQFAFSEDGTNFDDVYRFNMSSTGTATSHSRRFQFPVTAQYYRVKYETTTTATQNVFRVQTIKHRRNVLTSIHRLDADSSPDRSAQVIKSAIIAQVSGSGKFVPIQSNAAGNLKVGGAVEVETHTATGTYYIDNAGTATIGVRQSAHDNLNANANLQIGDADVTAANPVWVKLAASSTATQSVGITSYSATGSVITMPWATWGAEYNILASASSTAISSLATGVANTYSHLVGLTITNGATTKAKIRIRSSSTATLWHTTLAAEGGGFIYTPLKPREQAQVATDWDVQLDSSITGTVSISAQFLQVT